MSTKKKRYYVVVRGRQPGVYGQWYGEGGAKEQIEGYPEAIYKGFHGRQDAIDWLGQFSKETLLALAPSLVDWLESAPAPPPEQNPQELLAAGKVLIYTDGGALENPGPGGYGVVLRYGKHRQELSGGYRLTTNNRMELMACIQGLKALNMRCSVVLFSDSAYVVNSMTKGWAARWKANSWMRNGEEPVRNADLWQQLVDLCSEHDVEFRWVRGHAGNRENERCDQLAVAAARGPNLAIDTGYEAYSSAG
jgi:ribonuclease HI